MSLRFFCGARAAGSVFTLLLTAILPGVASAQTPAGGTSSGDAMATVPSLGAIIVRGESDLAPVIERFSADQQSLNRRYDAADSPDQRRRMRAFATAWRARLAEMDFGKLNPEGKADYVLLDNHLKHQIAELDRQERKRAETAPLLPFADRLLALQDARRNLVTLDPAAAARVLALATKQVDSMRVLFEPPPAGRGGAAPDSTRPRAQAPRVSRTVANRAADHLDQMRAVVTTWYRYYDGFDPMFSWWVKSPYAKLDSGLNRYARTLRERVVGIPPAAAQQLASGRGGGGGGAVRGR